MTTTLIATPDEPEDTGESRAARRRTSGEGTLYQRTDGRWEGAAYVPTAGGQTRRIRVYGKTRREAADKLTKKVNEHRQKLPFPARDSALGDS